MALDAGNGSKWPSKPGVTVSCDGKRLKEIVRKESKLC